jgi:hypothetical protein
MRLRPLYERLGVQRHTYREIVWQWFVLNRAPHTDWDRAAQGPSGGAPGRSDGKTERVEKAAPEDRGGAVAARVAALRG